MKSTQISRKTDSVHLPEATVYPEKKRSKRSDAEEGGREDGGTEREESTSPSALSELQGSIY